MKALVIIVLALVVIGIGPSAAGQRLPTVDYPIGRLASSLIAVPGCRRSRWMHQAWTTLTICRDSRANADG